MQCSSTEVHPAHAWGRGQRELCLGIDPIRPYTTPTISPIKLAGLFLFLAGAALVVVGFVIGWVDGSLGYTDMMIFALGLMLGGILLWRP